jgi:transcription termination factor NusB
MLATLRTNYDVIGKRIADCDFEWQERVKKFGDNEAILSEPVPPPEVLAKMEARLNQIRVTTVEMESRLVAERDRTKEDKLAIFRQQVSLVVKRKGELEEEIRNQIEERTQNELLISQKRKEIVG